jgi:hypothetical protein
VVTRWDGPDDAEALSIVQRVREASGAEPTSEERESEIQAIKYAEGTDSEEGFVQSVACDDGAYREVTLRSGEKVRTFRFGKENAGAGRSDVLWIGAEKFRICQHAQGLKATVRYKPGSDASASDEVVWIELLVDLIPRDAASSSAN